MARELGIDRGIEIRLPRGLRLGLPLAPPLPALVPRLSLAQLRAEGLAAVDMPPEPPPMKGTSCKIAPGKVRMCAAPINAE